MCASSRTCGSRDGERGRRAREHAEWSEVPGLAFRAATGALCKMRHCSCESAPAQVEPATGHEQDKQENDQNGREGHVASSGVGEQYPCRAAIAGRLLVRGSVPPVTFASMKTRLPPMSARAPRPRSACAHGADHARICEVRRFTTHSCPAMRRPPPASRSSLDNRCPPVYSIDQLTFQRKDALTMSHAAKQR